MSWFNVETISEERRTEIILTCLVCHGQTKVIAPVEIPIWERAVRSFKKDHKACAPPKNKPVRVPPPMTRYERILKDDD